jgi:hypothetical protein
MHRGRIAFLVTARKAIDRDFTSGCARQHCILIRKPLPRNASSCAASCSAFNKYALRNA